MEEKLTLEQALYRAAKQNGMKYPKACTNIDCECYTRCSHKPQKMRTCDAYLIYRWRRIRAIYNPEQRSEIKLCINCAGFERTFLADGNDRRCPDKKGPCGPFEACASWRGICDENA